MYLPGWGSYFQCVLNIGLLYTAACQERRLDNPKTTRGFHMPSRYTAIFLQTTAGLCEDIFQAKPQQPVLVTNVQQRLQPCTVVHNAWLTCSAAYEHTYLPLVTAEL